MDRNFTVSRKELIETLHILEPYIALPSNKETMDEEKVSNRITIPKPDASLVQHEKYAKKYLP